MPISDYYSSQLLTTSINIEPKYIRGDINNLIAYNIKKRYEGICNKDGYIEKNSIEIINRSIGKLKIVDNKSYIVYNITYKANVISPSIGDKIKCVINSNNKMGLIGYIQKQDSDTLENSPFIIIIPSDYFSNQNDLDNIEIGDTINVTIINFRTKYMAKQIQIVAKPL